MQPKQRLLLTLRNTIQHLIRLANFTQTLVPSHKMQQDGDPDEVVCAGEVLWDEAFVISQQRRHDKRPVASIADCLSAADLVVVRDVFDGVQAFVEEGQFGDQAGVVVANSNDNDIDVFVSRRCVDMVLADGGVLRCSCVWCFLVVCSLFGVDLCSGRISLCV